MPRPEVTVKFVLGEGWQISGLSAEELFGVIYQALSRVAEDEDAPDRARGIADYLADALAGISVARESISVKQWQREMSKFHGQEEA